MILSFKEHVKEHAKKVALIMLGGALGSILRHSLVWFSNFSSFLSFSQSGNADVNLIFPLEILCVNIIASFLLGCFMGRVKKDTPRYKEWHAFICIGFLGALSTFSTFALDTVLLMDRNYMLLAIVNIMLNVCLCLLAVRLGYGKLKI